MHPSVFCLAYNNALLGFWVYSYLSVLFDLADLNNIWAHESVWDISLGMSQSDKTSCLLYILICILSQALLQVNVGHQNQDLYNAAHT